MNNSNKQSSIDWLVDKLTDMIHESHHAELVEHMQKAREMHEKEIIDARVTAPMTSGDWAIDVEEAKKYYKQKYSEHHG